MTLRAATAAAAILVFLSGCTLVDRSPTPEPDYYRLSYKTETRQCASAFPAGVNISRFAADQPFGQRRMVLWGRNGTVRFSESAKWVAEPGILLSEAIRKDLSRSGMFSRVVEGLRASGVGLELSGRILRFVAEPCASGYRALLGVTVRLEKGGTEERSLFQKSYSLQSGCFPAKDAARFAEAMSRLVSEFSTRLRGDLCRSAQKELSAGK